MAQIFYQIDKDNGGTIDLEEIIELYREQFGDQMNEQQRQNITEHFAGQDKGHIEFSDFIVHAINEKLLSSSDRLATAFRYFDTDGSGTISPDEIVDGLNFDDNDDRMNFDIATAIMSQIQNELKELTFHQFILLINHYKAVPASLPLSPHARLGKKSPLSKSPRIL